MYLILWLQHWIKLTEQLIQWLPGNIGEHIETTPAIISQQKYIIIAMKRATFMLSDEAPWKAFDNRKHKLKLKLVHYYK